MDKYLIDTQIVLWLINSPEKINNNAFEIITAANTKLFFSYASIWEISIKVSIKKLELGMTLNDFIKKIKTKNDIDILQISLESIVHNTILPFIHKDPFDRLLACQSITENIPLISSDKIFDDYNLNRIW